MELFPRKEHIEFLVRRRFRWFLPDQNGELSILEPSGASRKYPNVREANKAYRDELLEKTPEEIQTMYEAEYAKEQEEQRAKAEQDEAQRFFNRTNAVADIAHWSKTPYWSLDEATVLSFGREPGVVKWENVKEYAKASPFTRKYEKLRDLVLRAHAVGQLDDPLVPGFYIAWAKRNEIDFPADLEAAVVARGVQIGDWKSKYDELSSLYDALLPQLDKLTQKVQSDQEIKNDLQARIAELEATLKAAPKPDLGLHGKERESVLKLIIGMAVRGYRYNPKATRSEVVTEITSDLEQVGVELTDDTVRKWLREAAELLPRSEGQ